MKRAVIKSVAAGALKINRKNIYRTHLKDGRDLCLKADIERIWKDNPAYGHLRLGWELNVNHKRISRVMRKFHLKPPRRKIHHFITRSTSNHTYTNLIQNWLPVNPNDLWCSDVSFIKFQGRFWYVTAIEDVVMW